MKVPQSTVILALLSASMCCLVGCSKGPGTGTGQPTNAKAAFSPHDLDGIWMPLNGKDGGAPLVDPNAHPPFTPWGQKRFDASFPSLGPRDVAGKENDPILKCYPDGMPKQLGSPHPFEIFMRPDRMVMIFEKDHDWRYAWTDGRKHNEGAAPTYNGYATGKWDGDTFVVDSTGFNDIPWLDYFGDPHSDAMHLTEYYKRLDHDTLSISVTIDDPKAYAAVWEGKPHLYRLKPTWDLQDYYCNIQDIQQYDKDVRLPAGAKSSGKASNSKTN
jgi:hypothetical protein